MIKLKKLLTEHAWSRSFGESLPTLDSVKQRHQENKKTTIYESTRWILGMEGPNGKVVSTYGHWDGYPKWAGKMLKKHYSNTAKVKDLLKLGKAGISSIEPKIKGSKDHTFNSPEKGVSVFYGRDRGEKTVAVQKFKNRDSIKWNMGEEYAYIWNTKDNKWYYKSRHSNPQKWTELK